jgi:hypothetical protein
MVPVDDSVEPCIRVGAPQGRAKGHDVSVRSRGTRRRRADERLQRSRARRAVAAAQ